jgi:hypothetical protein
MKRPPKAARTIMAALGLVKNRRRYSKSLIRKEDRRGRGASMNRLSTIARIIPDAIATATLAVETPGEGSSRSRGK